MKKLVRLAPSQLPIFSKVFTYSCLAAARGSSLFSSKLDLKYHRRTMASQAHVGMEQLDLAQEVQFPNSYYQYNPVDSYRSHIATLLAKTVGVDPLIVYPAVSSPQTLDKGDMVVAVPALRVKGQPQVLAEKWASEVSTTPKGEYDEANTKHSSHTQISLKNQLLMAPFFSSGSNPRPYQIAFLHRYSRPRKHSDKILCLDIEIQKTNPRAESA